MATLIKMKQLDDIDGDGPIQSGMTVALNNLLEEMCVLRGAALDWSDPEGVHKMRVASRRLRCALRDFAPWLRKHSISPALEQVKEIANALGRVRDQDVAIITLERTAARAPAAVAAGIRRLFQLRDARRRHARVKLKPILARESLAALNTKFKAALAGRARSARVRPSPKQNVSTEITYREVARSIILTRLADLEKLSSSLFQPHKIKPLHDLRIAAKHLRYALELFEQCWGAPVVCFAKEVAGLQSSLGKLHDCDIWLEDLGELGDDATQVLNPEQRATVVWLFSHFLKLRSKHLRAALIQWQEWESKDFSRRLRSNVEVTFLGEQSK